ncbi:MAG: type IX secretion system outer membrane channel protein PorV [Ignavibacteria bacterium]|nr:type IX secretion system outer membrane channel protein PorV [Ignavibacteria bacterium]
MNSQRIGSIFSVALIALVATTAFVPQIMLGQGESAVPFLLIAPNARADGMGEAGGALADDASAVFWNPASLAFQSGQEISLTHSNWLPQFQQSDLFYDFLSYRNHLDDWGGTFSASVTYLSLGEFVETGPNGPDPLSTFKAFETAVTAGYATKLFSDLGLGLNLRYIHSSLAPFDVQGQGRKGVASTVSFDVAGMWKPQALQVPGIGEIGDRLSIGLNISNLGPKLTYIDADQADPLPTNLRLGIAANVIKTEYNNVNFVVDFTRLLVRRHPAPTDSVGNTIGDPPPPDALPKALFTAWGDGGLKKVQIGTGVEYWYGSPRLVALRFGYFYEHPQYGNRKFLTFGAGVRYDVYGFDFSYLSAIEENHPLAETLRFTLLIAWGGKEE